MAELQQAASDIEEAARRKALWIPAQTALRDAGAAYSRGDYEAAIELAQTAQHFVQLGLKQLDSPPYRHY